MKYAAVDHFNSEEDDGTYGIHFGFFVQGVIVDNLSDRIYSNELTKLINSIYNKESENYKG